MPRGGKRENAGSGGARDGAGRPRVRWNSGGRGQAWIVETAKPGDLPQTQQWVVLDVQENGTIEFQNVETEEIISLIHPESYQ